MRTTTIYSTILLASMTLACTSLPHDGNERSSKGSSPESELHGGYLAVPRSGRGPGVLVLHAWWGLNDTIKRFCDRLAAEGYTAFAPDLYHGRIATTIEDAEPLAQEILSAQEQPRADIAEAVRILGEHAIPDSTIAVIGFSLGAYFALALSEQAPDRVRAVVVFYGTRPGDYSASKATYLGHFAELDDFEPASEVENLEKALQSAGRPVEFHTCPGAGHWFFEPDRTDAYRAEAAQLAWERTVAFLRRELTVPPHR